MGKVHVDFETRSAGPSLNDVGSFKYHEDPSTEVILCSYAFDHDPPVCVDLLTDPRAHEKLQPLFNAASSNSTELVAHNAQFEINGWRKQKRWAKTKLHQWNCTMARCAAMALPLSLEYAALGLGLTELKDKEGGKVLSLFTQPNKKTGAFVAPEEKPDEWEAFKRYNLQDVRTEQALDEKLPRLSLGERELWRFDYRVNDRGVPIDRDAVKKALSIVEQIEWDYDQEVQALTGFRGTQRDKLLYWLNRNRAGLGSLQAKELEAAVNAPGLSPEVRRVIKLRLELARAGPKKFHALLECMSTDERVRGALWYHAASTGRWSSRNVQFHNFARGENKDQEEVFHWVVDENDRELFQVFVDQPIAAMSKAMRGFITAQYDRLLGCVDYSAIEARILAWLAGETWLVNAFRARKDPYKIMAADVFGISVDAVNGDQRFFGKQAVLGAGFGLGWEGFIAQCAKFGVEITPAFARTVIEKYRKSAPKIVKSWRAAEAAMTEAIRNGKARYKALECSFGMEGDFLTIRLPSGRKLAYYKPKLTPDVTPWGAPTFRISFSAVRGKMLFREGTWGGKIVENIVQATARDVMADGMLKAEADGFPVILTVHDEIITERAAMNDNDLDALQRLLIVPPEWASPLPLAVEGFVRKRYGKK